METSDNDKKCPNGECRHAPWTCLRGIVVDASVIAGMYAILALALDKGSSLSVDGTLTFFALFVPISFAIKAMNLEYSDQLPRVAFFHLATKMFNALASGLL